MREFIKEYWNDTRTGFRKGADEVEKKWKEYLAELGELVAGKTAGKKRLAAALVKAETARDFFAGLPWRPAE